MKRFHVHLSVDDLAQSTDFYNKLFGQSPSIEKPDYAKWMLDDPRVNFAISKRGYQQPGINHFGFQAEDAAELSELKQKAEAAAGEAVLDEGETVCCYANSTKHWTTDPSGIPWEHYHTMSEAQTYGKDTAMNSDHTVSNQNIKKGCCAPATNSVNSCC